MAPAKLKPNDPRVTHNQATVNGHSYHYIVAKPPGGRKATGTIILIHGFPDLGFGWRNQVPLLAEELGLEVIVPDMLGYGQTDAPDEIAPYSYKSTTSDLVALVDRVGVVGGGEKRQFFVGGHDWGGAVAWRLVNWHADRVRGVFSVCTPYFVPWSGDFLPPTDLVKLLPNFQYQLQFGGDELWRISVGPDREKNIRQFLNILYGGRAQTEPKFLFNTTNGVDLKRINEAGHTPLLSPDELDYYVAEYSRHGLRGPTNWYRTQRVNYDEDRELLNTANGEVAKVTVPAFMLVAAGDSALPPSMAEGMGKHFTNLTKAEIPGSHWALWQSADVANEKIKAFLAPLVGAEGSAKASI